MWIGARQNLGDKVRKPVVRAAGRPVGDMIFGPIYYRRLVRHQKLDQRLGNELVDHILSYVKS